MPEAAITAGCEDIAAQLISFEVNLRRKFPNTDVDGLEVVLFLGGKRDIFYREPSSMKVASKVCVMTREI